MHSFGMLRSLLPVEINTHNYRCISGLHSYFTANFIHRGYVLSHHGAAVSDFLSTTIRACHVCFLDVKSSIHTCKYLVTIVNAMISIDFNF